MLRWVGALVVAAGLVLLFIGATKLFGGDRDSDSPTALFSLIGGIVSVLLGLASIAFGEVIGVLFAIENNTHRTAHLLTNPQKPGDGPAPGTTPSSLISYDY